MEQLLRKGEGNKLDAHDLVVFARVADLGSFSLAAQWLGMPKSTVSRRLQGLEQHLGERLLVRTTRRQSLTEMGQLLLAHARQVEAELAAVMDLREHRRDAPMGRLRVTMPSDFANLVLADALAAFVERYPGVMLDLDLSPRRVDLIAEGFDVAVRMGTLADDAQLRAKRLMVFENSLYAAPAYLQRYGRPQTPDDLAQHVGVRLLDARGEAQAWSLRNANAHWQGVAAGRISANAPEMLIRFALAGSGIAALPDRFAQSELNAGHLEKVLPDWHLPQVPAWAVFPERQLMPAKTRAFIDMLEQTLGP